MNTKRTLARFLSACLLLLPVAAVAQLRTPTYGWNLGNTMEAPDGEGTWSPVATQKLINAVADAGFNTIRLPCAWDSHADQKTHEIDPAWLARVQQVVDWCYARNLVVILNNHWDKGWLDEHIKDAVDPATDAKMAAYWKQIALRFRNYDSRLLFAGANEPPAETPAQMATLLAYYQTFVNTVRATGGKNATRWLVVQGPGTNIDKTDKLMNSLPKDPTPDRLAVEVHYYDPYQFALMTADADWGKMFYFWGQGYHHPAMPERNATRCEEAYVDEQFELMRAKYVSKGIPVLLGEFGAMRRAGREDLTGPALALHKASMTYFNKTMIDKALAKGLSPVYWDEGYIGRDCFGLFDRNTAALVDPDDARALTGGPALPPVKFEPARSSP